jgi:hypothetical protein
MASHQKGKDKTGSCIDEKTGATKQTASKTAQSGKESGQVGKEKTGGMLQQVML